jgi:hypothetical protein
MLGVTVGVILMLGVIEGDGVTLEGGTNISNLPFPLRLENSIPPVPVLF